MKINEEQEIKWKAVAAAYREILEALGDDDVVLKEVMRQRGFGSLGIKTDLDAIELYNLANHEDK